MNLEDLVDEQGLQQDEWSLTAPTFGKEGQLTVVGWSGRPHNNKLYILKCEHCSKDTELFGEGYFKALKSHLGRDCLPCGCSKRPNWSKEQYYTLCSRKAKELGYEFLGFTGEWKKQHTCLEIRCKDHGEWCTGVITGLINNESGCPACGSESTRLGRLKPDGVMIKSFFASGGFHPDTKFWRSDRQNKNGFRNYWFMFCPECGESGESYHGGLQGGHRPCACSPMRQKECYINTVMDGHMPVAIKFGIANNSSQRLKEQNRLSVYEITQSLVYTFPDVASCKRSERECLQELECGVVFKRDMPDGWTETTWPFNLEKIIEIYERNGGELK